MYIHCLKTYCPVVIFKANNNKYMVCLILMVELQVVRSSVNNSIEPQ